jgi:hypothetical protein
MLQPSTSQNVNKKVLQIVFTSNTFDKDLTEPDLQEDQITESSSPAVNFINVFRALFSYKCRFSSFFYVRTYVHTKKERENVDEIDSKCQFYQHFSRHCLCVRALHSFSLLTFWLCNFFGKIILAQNLLVKC